MSICLFVCYVWFKLVVYQPPVGEGWGHHHDRLPNHSGHHRITLPDPRDYHYEIVPYRRDIAEFFLEIKWCPQLADGRFESRIIELLGISKNRHDLYMVRSAISRGRFLTMFRSEPTNLPDAIVRKPGNGRKKRRKIVVFSRFSQN